MKAAVLYGNEDLRYADYPTPEAGPGQVKIRVRAVGICGSDVPRVLHGGAHFYPVVLGHEFSGDVVEVGEGVSSVKVGDTVSGAPLLPCMKCDDCKRGNYSLCRHYSFVGSREQGAFAEYVALPEICAVPYDPSIPYEQAAMFEPSTVALHGLFCNDYRGGGNVAVLGCGTIGIFAVQWAKIFGAKRVVAFDIDGGRLDLARRMGADAGVEPRNADCREQAEKALEGEEFDYLFEAAGSTDTMRLAFLLAGNRARLCFIGTPHGEMNFSQNEWEYMNRKEFLLTGSWMSYSAPYPGKEWGLTAHCFATGQLRFAPEFIFRRFPLSKAAEAFELFRRPQEVHGKIMLINEEREP